VDVTAAVGDGAATAAVRGSGKRGGGCEIDERSHKMGSTKLKKMDAGEKAAALLKQNGRLLLGVLVLLLVVHDIFGTHGYLAMRRTESDIKKVQAEIEELNKENLDLAQEVKELKTDPAKIENIARDELGLARPGEVIIKIPQSQQLPQGSTRKP